VVLDANIDFMLEKRMRVFDELGSVPVLLSLLILCLRAQSEGGDSVRLPEDLFELYYFAIESVLRRELGSEAHVARSMLRRIATANHLAQRRFFLLNEVKDALSGHDDELLLWMRLMRAGSFPLVKVLASDGEKSGEFQFKHLCAPGLLRTCPLPCVARRWRVPSAWLADRSRKPSLSRL
jgi:hypothetical protein